jgi:hypothetical protein
VNGWDDLVNEALEALEGAENLARARERSTPEGLKREGDTPYAAILKLKDNRDTLYGGWVGENGTNANPDDPEVWAALAAIVGAFVPATVTVITPRPGRGELLLDGELAAFHTAVDQLNRETCRGAPCQVGHRCRRHTRRVKQ